jgi:hypothetical protein
MIEKFYNTNVTILRNEWTDESGIEGSELAPVSEAKGHLQQSSPVDVQNYAGNYTISHSLWLPCGTNIEKGDTVYIDDSMYTVRAIQNNCFVGSNKHLKVLIEQSNERVTND